MKKKADIYRMATPDHLCPWGIKALDLLKRNDLEVNDYHLESEEANQRYKGDNGVDETLQIFIEGERLGGYDEPRQHLGLGPDPKEGETYQPVVAIFAVTFFMALTASWAILGSLNLIRVAELFIWVVAPIVLVASSIGAISIIKAVYIRKAGLKVCLRGRRQQRAARLHLPHGKPYNDGDGYLDAGASGVVLIRYK